MANDYTNYDSSHINNINYNIDFSDQDFKHLKSDEPFRAGSCDFVREFCLLLGYSAYFDFPHAKHIARNLLNSAVAVSTGLKSNDNNLRLSFLIAQFSSEYSEYFYRSGNKRLSEIVKKTLTDSDIQIDTKQFEKIEAFDREKIFDIANQISDLTIKLIQALILANTHDVILNVAKIDSLIHPLFSQINDDTIFAYGSICKTLADQLTDCYKLPQIKKFLRYFIAKEAYLIFNPREDIEY